MARPFIIVNINEFPWLPRGVHAKIMGHVGLVVQETARFICKECVSDRSRCLVRRSVSFGFMSDWLRCIFSVGHGLIAVGRLSSGLVRLFRKSIRLCDRCFDLVCLHPVLKISNQKLCICLLP